jgi:DNA-binding PadR family transcriptional regulator|tara:strand:- start:71 stop:313 length:243 start_codon:yes stop_codon:yes gene_type:complete
MENYIHSIIATGCLASAYYLGRYLAGRDILENTISSMLDRLEKDGFIATETDKDGDTELIPISEFVAKALRETKKKIKKV